MNKPIIDFERLREGKEVKCPACKDGVIKTPHNPKTAHFFKCTKCNYMINFD